MRNGPYELVIAPPGYPGMKYRGRYCYEHHLVWWQITGSLPGPDELIHHKNEDKRDNRFANLELKTRSAHSADHGRERGDGPVVVTCGTCNRPFGLPARQHRQRIKQTISGKLFCSRSCQVVHQHSEVV